MRKLLITAAVFTSMTVVGAYAANFSVNVKYAPPTTRMDGSKFDPEKEMAKYKLYVTRCDSKNEAIDLGAKTTSYTYNITTDTVPCKLTFNMSVVDTNGIEGIKSDNKVVTKQPSVPAAPTLTVTIQ